MLSRSFFTSFAALAFVPAMTLVAACSSENVVVHHGEIGDEGNPGDTADGGDEVKTTKDAGAHVTKDSGPGVDPFSDDDAGVPTTDGGTVLDASPSDAGVCNTVPRGKITPVAVNGFADLKGGTLVDGYYLPTAYKRYISGTSGTTFPPISLGLHIQGNVAEFSTSYGGGEVFDYTFTATGSQMKLPRTCGTPSGTETWYYDANGDTLTIYGFPGSNDLWYATFQRQP